MRWNEGQRLKIVALLARSLGEPILESGNGAKRFGINFPGHGGPEDGDAVGEAVETHAVFSVVGGLLEPQDSAVVGFFDIHETVAASEILKCFEFLHVELSLRPFE